MIDRLNRFPNQGTENRAWECIGETVADIVGNIKNQAMDPGFTYGAMHRLQNKPPKYLGGDSIAGMQTAILYGCLPTEDATFDATKDGEDYEADLNNYPTYQKQLAQNFTKDGLLQFTTYQQIADYLNTTGWGVSMTIKFYSSFYTKGTDDTLPPPIGSFTLHNVAVYDCEDKGLKIKMWLGEAYGYAYIPEVLFPLIFVNASGFYPKGWRWYELAKIATQHWNVSGDVYNAMKRA